MMSMRMMRLISTKGLKELLSSGVKLVLLSVVERAAFEKKHIPGSINIPLKEIEARAPEVIGRDEKVVVYCAGSECARSGVAAEKLEEMGYGSLIRFAGGVEEWKRAGYRLEGTGVKRAA